MQTIFDSEVIALPCRGTSSRQHTDQKDAKIAKNDQTDADLMGGVRHKISMSSGGSMTTI